MHAQQNQNQNIKRVRTSVFALALLLGSVIGLHHLFNGALMQAIEAGNVARVRGLIAVGADVNAVGWPTSKNGLMYLIDRSDHPEFYTERTALMLAATEDNPAVVQVLLEHGADVHASAYNHTMTALTWAAACARLDNLRLLLKYGAGRDSKELTKALIEAAAYYAMMKQDQAQYREIILVLLQQGANINGTDAAGSYALTLAVQSNGDIEAIQYLLQQGADPNVKDWSGTTPLQWAQQNNNPTLSKMLQGAGEKE